MSELGAALGAADAFERTDAGFSVDTATFDARVVAGAESVSVTVILPTIDAVVEGESVADVVADGWYETLVRRLDGVTAVSQATVADPVIDRLAEEIVVEVDVDPRPGHVAADVLAVVNFIEGTWVGGIIPGYDYVDRIQALRTAAAQQGGSDAPTTDRD